MWKRVPGRSSPALTWGWVLALAWLALAAGKALSEGKEANPPPASGSADNIINGKSFCSLKRQVELPFKGIITSLRVQSSQRVAEGEVLARYRLTPDAVLQVRRRLAPPQIKDLEMRLAEMEKNLAALGDKQRELTQLTQQKLASAQSKIQIDRDIQLLARQRTAVQEQLSREKQLAQDDLAFLKKQLGETVKPGQIPQEAVLVAPIEGHVIWVNPDLREDQQLEAATPAFQIGVMDPMLVRAQAYEIEAMQLSLGEVAEVTMESLSGRKFEAQVSRISWAPLAAALDQPSYYEVELKVANPDLILREGLKARIVFRKSK